MAIAGLLVHCLKEELKEIESVIESMPGMTLFGAREEQYLVVVLETPAAEMKNRVDGLKNIEGILSVYTTYMSIEDELEYI